MELVEFYRNRWLLVWWTLGLVVVAIPLLALVTHTAVDVNGNALSGSSGISGLTLPAAALAPVAMFIAMVFATSAGLSLHNENETRALSWTKPIPRWSIALRMFAVDLAFIGTMYAIAWLVTGGVVAAGHAHVVVDERLLPMIALSLGCAVMWYALIELLTSRLDRNGGAVVGFLWPAALFLAAINGQFGGSAVHAIVSVLNVVNPLAYLGGVTASASGSATTQSFWQLPPDERALAVWAIAFVLGAVAVLSWTRREA